MLQPYDKLVLLSAGYADSLEMEKAQEHYFKTEKVPKKWKNCFGTNFCLKNDKNL